MKLLIWLKVQYIQTYSESHIDTDKHVWDLESFLCIYLRADDGRSIVVGVTGFKFIKLTISMCSLIRWSCNLVEVLFEVTCVVCT